MSIREVRPNVWDVQVYLGKRSDGSWERATKRVYGGVRAAEKAERDLAAARDRGQRLGPTPRLKAYSADWLDGKTDIEGQTRRNYGAAINRYIVPVLGDLKMREDQAPDVRRLNRAMAKKGLSGSTRRYAFRILSMIMRQAVIDRLIDVSPCEAVKPPKESRQEPRALSSEEYASSCRASPAGRFTYLPSWPTTPGSAAVSCSRSAGRTSTSTPARSAWSRLSSRSDPKCA